MIMHEVFTPPRASEISHDPIYCGEGKLSPKSADLATSMGFVFGIPKRKQIRPGKLDLESISQGSRKRPKLEISKSFRDAVIVDYCQDIRESFLIKSLSNRVPDCLCFQMVKC